jgi:DNA-directed RNA polymerase specialized sigma24 family protein
MKNGFRWLGQKAGNRGEYASKEEFAKVFESERAGLQRLALLPTVNSESARRCLIRAFRECIARGAVSREWVLSWARRKIICNAISLVMGPGSQSLVNTNDDAGCGPNPFYPDDVLDPIAAPELICELPELERLVFVICVLERYSIHDCALLLGKSPREVKDLRNRVSNQVGRIDEHDSSPERSSDEVARPVRGGGAK